MIRSNYILEPFLHFIPGQIYNPITDRTISSDHPYFDLLHQLRVTKLPKQSFKNDELTKLADQEWIISRDTPILDRYRLKVVTLEATSHCNQRCNFCPVSISPKDVHTMSLAFYESIVRQLATFKHVEAVFMINYNEPTLDRFFLDRIKILKKYGLPVCINTNGTGLTPSKIDAIMQMGGIRFLSVNLSSLDQEYYREERNYNGLSGILRNLDYLSKIKIAEEMAIAVLGENDQRHKMNFQEIKRYFEGSTLTVKSYPITDRASCLDKGLKLNERIEKLAGCDLLGSRPLQHIHINSYGKVFLCCQDYFEEYTVGDLNVQSVDDVLVSKEMQELRAMSYGIKEAPDDFICRKCVFALSCDKKLVHAR